MREYVVGDGYVTRGSHETRPSHSQNAVIRSSDRGEAQGPRLLTEVVTDYQRTGIDARSGVPCDCQYIVVAVAVYIIHRSPVGIVIQFTPVFLNRRLLHEVAAAIA